MIAGVTQPSRFSPSRVSPARFSASRRRAVAAIALLALAAGPLAGCGSDGASTDCSLRECTITFDRGVEAGTSVLGVRVELESATGNEATLSVAGQTVTIPADSSRQVAGLTVRVHHITADEVVVAVSR
jgi:hypothetical protein